MRSSAIGALCCAMMLAVPVAAQTPQPSQGLLGGLSGLAGGGGSGLFGSLLPGVGGTTASNAAGLLGYCVRNNILGGAAASSTLGSLTGRQGITSSSGYAAGQAGQVVTGSGQALSLDGMKTKVKSKVCDLVLQRARSFLGGSAPQVRR